MRRRKVRQINLRINEEFRRKLETAAEERGISTNQLMRQLLEDGLENKAKQFENLARSVAKAVVQELGVQRMGSPRPLLDTPQQQRKKEEDKT
jgi:hypothetical protein